MHEQVSGITPNFIIIFCASIVLIAVSIWVGRRKTADRLGARRFWISGSALVLFLLAVLFGMGSYDTHVLGTTGLEAAPGMAEALPATLKVARSDEFLRYHAALASEELAFDGPSLEPLLDIRFEPSSSLPERSQVLSPPPKPHDLILTYKYEEHSSYVLRLLGVGERAQNQRFQYAQALVNDYLAELLFLEVYRQAKTDEGRIAALYRITDGVPMTAEWLQRALLRFREKKPSPAVSEVLDKMLAYVQRYIDDPTMRALPAGTKISLEGTAHSEGQQ